MQYGPGEFTAEIERFGPRLHGEVRETTLTLPSGNAVTVGRAAMHTAAISGVSAPYGLVVNDTDDDVYLKNYAVLSWMPSGAMESTMCGVGMPGNGAPFVASSGRVWFVSWDSNLDTDASSWSFSARRFGEFGLASDDFHTLAVANPVVGDPDYANLKGRLWDVLPDGSKQLHRLATGGLAKAWLDLTISEVSATQLSISAALVRTRAQTVGTMTETPPTSTPAVPASRWWKYSPLGNGWSGSEQYRFDYYDPVTEVWEPTGSGHIVHTDGGYPFASLTERMVAVSDHLAALHYDAAGGLVETTIDASLSLTFQRDEPSSSHGGMPQTVTWTVSDQGDGTYVTSGDPMSASMDSACEYHNEATATYTVRRGADAFTQTASVVISGRDSSHQSITITPDATPISNNAPNYTTTGVKQFTHDWTADFNVPGASIPQQTYSNTSSSPINGFTILDAVHGNLSSVSTCWADAMFATLWGLPIEQKVAYLMDGVRCQGNVAQAPLIEVYVSSAMRSNSLWGVAAAVVDRGANAILAANEAAMFGRFGLVAGFPIAIPAVWNSAASPPLAFNLPNASQQPVTGSVIRGGTTSERVGWV